MRHGTGSLHQVACAAAALHRGVAGGCSGPKGPGALRDHGASAGLEHRNQDGQGRRMEEADDRPCKV